MQFMWKYIEDFVGKGLEINIMMQLIFYIALSLVPMALPLAILLASLMTFGNLGESYELTALKAAGISLQRIFAPLIFLTALISIGAFFFANDVIPYANLKMKSMIYDIQRQKPEFQLTEGVFYNGIEGYSIRVTDKDPETNKLYDLKIYDHTDERGNVKVTVADSGLMKMTEDEQNLIITLYDGKNYIEVEEEPRNLKKRTFPQRQDHFKKQQVILDLSGFGLHRTDEGLFKSNYQMMNMEQLNFHMDSINHIIKKKKENFYSSILSSNYFKLNYYPSMRDHEDNSIYTDSIWGDAFNNKDLLIHQLPLFKQFDEDTRERMLQGAINHARRAKDFIYVSSNDLQNKRKSLYKYHIEWHRKFTLAFACFIFFFIGAPMGAIVRKGGFGMPIVISVIFFIFYYIITITGEKFVKELFIMPYQGMWLPSAILLPLGIFLTYKATTDSSLLNMEVYAAYFRKIMPVSKEIPLDKKFNIPETSTNIHSQHIITSLDSLVAMCDEQIEEIERSQVWGLRNLTNLSTIFYYRNQTRYREFCQYYQNIYGEIYSQFQNDHMVTGKLKDLPKLNFRNQYMYFFNSVMILALLFIFLPVGVLVFIVKYTQLLMLKNKIQNIKNITQNISSTIEFQMAQ